MGNMLTCLLCTVYTMGMLGMILWNTSDDDPVIAAHRSTSLENLKFSGPCIVIKTNEIHNFSNLFAKVLYMFRTGPLSIIRSISTLYTQQ